MKNYYEILEVNKKASQEVIEKAYKVLIKKYHPDGQVSAKKYECSEKVKEINEAYEVLSNPFLRTQYDSEIEKEEKRRSELEYKNIINEQKKEQEKRENNVKENEQYRVQKVKKNDIREFVDYLIEILKNRKKRDHMKHTAKKDFFAVILTICIIIILGIILWFIPFTNQWVRELLYENPIFNAIGALFSGK